MAVESLNDGVFTEKSDVVNNLMDSDMLGSVLIGEESLSWS